MKITKMQEEINQAEWENPDNWSTIYFSKKDTRPCVPKRIPKHGWTINFGSPTGARWIYYVFLMFFVLGGVIGALVGISIMAVQ